LLDDRRDGRALIDDTFAHYVDSRLDEEEKRLFVERIVNIPLLHLPRQANIASAITAIDKFNDDLVQCRAPPYQTLTALTVFLSILFLFPFLTGFVSEAPASIFGDSSLGLFVTLLIPLVLILSKPIEGGKDYNPYDGEKKINGGLEDLERNCMGKVVETIKRLLRKKGKLKFLLLAREEENLFMICYVCSVIP